MCIRDRSKGEKIPFDVTTIRAFDYDLTDLDNVEQLRERLQKTIQSFDFTKKSEDEDVYKRQAFSCWGATSPYLFSQSNT